MANNKMIINERQRDLGHFLVGRLLPFRKKRQVGPFVFIDHMGPSTISPGHYMDVDQHPHIGLSTLTYLFEGAIEHKDSTGAVQLIQPGDVGFMTAGHGVTHTERTPASYRDGNNYTVHGYQVWVALPKMLEMMDPQFDHYPASSIPQWEEDGLTLKLVAGKAFGKTAPLGGFSPLFMVDIYAKEEKALHLEDKLSGEVAFVIVRGQIKDDGEIIEAGQMLISKSDQACCIEMAADTQILLFGGDPFPEERFLLWNFAASSKERLEEAKWDWINKEFPEVPGDHTYIPFPS